MYEFQCPAPVDVLVRLNAGSLEIVAEDRQTATVEVAPVNDSDAARTAAENTRVDLRDGRLIVEPPESGGLAFRWRSAQLRVSVRVPMDCTLQLKVGSSDASCHGRYAGGSVTSASGEVYLEQVTGDLSVTTASGNVRVVEVGGQLRVNAASGDLTAQIVHGEITARAASGDLEVEQADGGLRATTASGDVRVGVARRGAMRINCASGDVSIGVAQGTGVWLDLTTMSGATRSDLAVSDSDGIRQHDLTLQVRTASGDITVHRVAQPAAA